MANPNDLETLCQGAKAWNAWREKNPDIVPDLTDANLSLSQRQFGPATGGPINLRGANLAGAALRYATLTGADLEDANLAGADLVHARLEGANLTGADLTDATFEHADLDKAIVDSALMTGASFANARNMTQDQIAMAHGDASTLLPAALMPPASWFPELEDDLYLDYPVPEQAAAEDLYMVLGVARAAKPEEVRSAFRNLVKKLHPDVKPGDDEAQESFKKVSTAYRILSDAEKRARYDKGEIGTDGEVTPEFEAKRQFRRYAFRFYAAAAVALLLAVGVLGAVWHAVLTKDGNGRVEIAVKTGPKSSERLDADPSAAPGLKVDFRRQPQLSIAEDAGDASAAAGTELLTTPSLGDERSGAAPTAEGEQDQAKADSAPARNLTQEGSQSAGGMDAGPPAEGQAPALDIPGKQASLPAGTIVGDLPENRATETPAENTGEAASIGPVPQAEQDAKADPDAKAEQDAKPEPDTQAEPEPAAAQAPQEPAPAVTTPQVEHLRSAVRQFDQLYESKAVAPAPAASAPAAPETQAEGAQTAAPSPPPPAVEPPLAEPQTAPPHDEKVTTRPLFEDHKGEEARPAQADAARSGAPSIQGGHDAGPRVAALPLFGRRSPAGVESFLPKAEGRTGGADAISALFRQHAIRQALARDQEQSTASMDPLAPRDDAEPQDEIRDIYTHSLPDVGGPPGSAWPGFTQEKKSSTHRRGVRPAPGKNLIAKVPPQEAPPAAARKQAVSDILAGGL